MDFKDLLPLARRRWKSIVSMVVLGVAIAAGYSFLATPIYQSTARIFLSTDVANASETYVAGAFGAGRIASYAQLATSGEIMDQVIDKLHANLTPSELASKISATVPTNTVILEIAAHDPDPHVAQQLAQAEAETLSKYIATVETPANSAATPIKATITDKANFSDHPVSPRKVLNIAIGFLLGLIIGCVLAVLRDLLDTTIKSPNDVAHVTDAPVMSHMVFDPDVPKQPILAPGSANSARMESFRVLRTNLQFLDLDNPPKSFVITSAVPSEGKTSTSINLAISLAQTGQRVLLVDGDLRRPRLARLLGLESAVGLTTVLVGRSDLASSIQHHSSGIDVLASGPIPPNPTEILQSRATRELVGTMGSAYDVVIIDAPPLLPVADAAVLSTHAAGAIMVVRHGKTTRDQLRHATNRLQQVGARLFGVTMNMTPRRSRIGDAGYSYGYGYGYGYDDDKSVS